MPNTKISGVVSQERKKKAAKESKEAENNANLDTSQAAAEISISVADPVSTSLHAPSTMENDNQHVSYPTETNPAHKKLTREEQLARDARKKERAVRRARKRQRAEERRRRRMEKSSKEPSGEPNSELDRIASALFGDEEESKSKEKGKKKSNKRVISQISGVPAVSEEPQKKIKMGSTA